ncbi:MAG: hypothetical protein HeimC3_00040 [Candidatus Heimdallarchaeota archaeon LC_3]|nr:MAG: hypothetical protein HeimC3_00040 [Candidatus Heimdallarchaeota archaeon LC_3]
MLRLYNNSFDTTKKSFRDLIQDIEIPSNCIDKINILLDWYGSLKSCNKYEIIAGCLFITLQEHHSNMSLGYILDFFLKKGIQFSLGNIEYVIMFISQFPM